MDKKLQVKLHECMGIMQKR